MSNQVSLPKISSILQKMKIGQNSIYALFAPRPSIISCPGVGILMIFFRKCQNPHPLPDLPPLGLDIDRCIIWDVFSALIVFELTVFLQPVLGGHPVLSNHLAIPQGCLLNKGWTVYTLFLISKKNQLHLIKCQIFRHVIFSFPVVLLKQWKNALSQKKPVILGKQTRMN